MNMHRTSQTNLLSNATRQLLIKAIITVLVIITGYYITFVVFRRTAADSTVDSISPQLNSEVNNQSDDE